MKKTMLLAAMMLTLSGLSANAGDWDQKSINEAIEKGKSGKRVDLRKTYPEDQVNLIYFEVSGANAYLIDVKAKLCYYRWQTTDARGATTVGAVALVPCRSLKDGYPIMAPIIDWEK